MISNYIKREHPDTKASVLPRKRKKKAARDRSRKRRRSNNQRDGTESKAKKLKTVEPQPESSTVESNDENVEQSVSRMFDIFF